MSKQSEAKIAQGYVPKAIPATCMFCVHFKSDITWHNRWGREWVVEKNRRCSLGGFAAKKMGTCNCFERKP